MSIFQKFFLIAGLQLISAMAIAGQAQVDTVQFLNNVEGSRIIFGISTAVSKGVFQLHHPDRLVIDFKNTRLNKALPQPAISHPLFAKIRSGERNGTDLRIVVDLKKPFADKNLKIATDNLSGRFIVGVFANGNTFAPPEKSRPQIAIEENSFKINDPETKPIADVQEVNHIENTEINRSAFDRNKEIVIAIDAGHGGIDAGARGPNGTLEKKVVFAIAKKLAQRINSQPGMRAVMVRKGDVYIGLRKRMKIARDAKADLFVSLHADAINDSSVKGASVYTLSSDGASSEAAHWLAKSENAADLIGGVSLDDKDDVLASVLLDLSQSATKEASRSVARKVLKYFNVIGKLHKNDVQKAGFMVLKSPDIPSILIETAFISNPSEENELRNNDHQEKVAFAVFKGIDSYFKEYAPVNTRVASSQ